MFVYPPLQMTDAFAETRNVFETLVQDLVDKVEKDNGFGTRIDAVSTVLFSL